MKEKLQKIMKRAWEIKKENVKNIFAYCLKMAWEESKKPALTAFAIELKCEEVAETVKARSGSDYVKVCSNLWEKGEHSRVYFTIRAYRKSKLKKEIPCGYFDNKTKEYVPMQNRTIEATNLFEYKSQTRRTILC